MLAGILCLENSDGAGLRSGVVDLPWKDRLCCASRSAHSGVEGDAAHAPQSNGSQASLPDDPQCRFRSSMSKAHLRELSGRRAFFRISLKEHGLRKTMAVGVVPRDSAATEHPPQQGESKHQSRLSSVCRAISH